MSSIGVTWSGEYRWAEARGTLTKPGTQRVPGGLMQATQVAFVPVACPFMGQAAPTNATACTDANEFAAWYRTTRSSAFEQAQPERVRGYAPARLSGLGILAAGFNSRTWPNEYPIIS